MSDFENLYREIILDHYRSPRNRGELPEPAKKVEGFNPLCGDEVVVFLEVTDGVLSNIKISGHGCSISQSSASLMSAAVKGKPIDQVREKIATFKQLMMGHEKKLTNEDEQPKIDVRALGELAALQGVVKFPVRIKCATLSWNTLSQGLDELSL